MPIIDHCLQQLPSVLVPSLRLSTEFPLQALTTIPVAQQTVSKQTMTHKGHEFLCGGVGVGVGTVDEFVRLNNTRSSDDVLRGTVDEKSAGKITRYVVNTFQSLTQSEEFQDLITTNKQSSSSSMCHVQHSKLNLGSCIGQGSFSSVYKVVSIDMNNDNDDSKIDAVEADKVVVKILRRKVTENSAVFAAAAAGLAKEGAMLSSLAPHKNIIQMHAFSAGGLAMYRTGRNDSFFIMLDRLSSEMLKDRIHRWYDIETHLMFSVWNRQEKFRSFFLERLKVASELANALAYLHSNNILHRDIKPQNVGFDYADGTLKLFDFDVSRILPKESYQDELFQLSIATGTQRYMSPECALTGKYNLKSDVYSFAILFHEILSLYYPFAGISKEEFDEVVFREGRRPKIQESWPRSIQSLLENAWSSDIKVRPCMEQIHGDILQEIKEIEHQQQNTNARRTKRRSHLFKKASIRRRTGQHWPEQ